MLSNFQMNGKDPTKGNEGKDGGYLRIVDVFLSSLVNIEMTRHATENQRIFANRNIFRDTVFPVCK